MDKVLRGQKVMPFLLEDSTVPVLCPKCGKTMPLQTYRKKTLCAGCWLKQRPE